MLSEMWAEVLRLTDEHEYMTGIERTHLRVRATAEIFTPTALVVRMLSDLPHDRFSAGKRVLDPACGDGQFLVAVKWAKVLVHGMAEHDALEDLYGVDVMADNVEMCRRRLGGGTIVVGDALQPEREVSGQTPDDQRLMRDLFGARQLSLGVV